MTATIDLLDGINADHIIKAGVSRPELHVLCGDQLLVRAVDTAEIGAIVVTTDERGNANLARWTGEAGTTVVGLVVGVYRRLA